MTFGQPAAPILHVAPPVFWMGCRPVVSDNARIATAVAHSPVACAMIPRRRVRAMLDKWLEWRRNFVALSLECGDTAALAGSDLLAANAEARLIEILVRFAGLRGAAASEEKAAIM